MKYGQVNKNQIKKAFSLLEPSAQVQEDIWNKIEKQIDEPTVGRMIKSENRKRTKEKGYYRKFFLKAAAFLVLAVGILGAIDRMNGGKMMKVLANFWKVDKDSQHVVQKMTDYHVKVDTAYAPELLEDTKERIIFAGTFGVVIYDQERGQVEGTIDLDKIQSNFFGTETLKTRFIVDGDNLYIYNCQEGKPYGKYYRYDLGMCKRNLKKKEISSLSPVETKKVTENLEKQRKKSQRYKTTWEQFSNAEKIFEGKIYSEKCLRTKVKNGGIQNSCLVLKKNAGTSKYQMYIYRQNKNTKKITKDKLYVFAIESDAEEKNYPKYYVADKNSMKQALINCFYENPKVYAGSVYHGKNIESTLSEKQYELVLPIIQITGIKKQGDTVKIIGAFYWYGFVTSGKTLYESDADGNRAVAYLKETKDGYKVEKIICPRDGGYYRKDLDQLYGKDDVAVQKTLDMDVESGVVETLKEYVKQNQQKFVYYKAFGRDPQNLK